MNLQMIFYIIFTALIISLPVNFIKLGSDFFIYALICYSSLILLYSYLLKTFDVAYIYSFLNILSVLMVTVISIFLFNSDISLFTAFGIFFSIVAIIMFICDNYFRTV